MDSVDRDVELVPLTDLERVPSPDPPNARPMDKV
jgi:hypothetical protein